MLLWKFTKQLSIVPHNYFVFKLYSSYYDTFEKCPLCVALMCRSCNSVFILELDINCVKITKVFGSWMKMKTVCISIFGSLVRAGKGCLSSTEWKDPILPSANYSGIELKKQKNSYFKSKCKKGQDLFLRDPRKRQQKYIFKSTMGN